MQRFRNMIEFDPLTEALPLRSNFDALVRCAMCFLSGLTTPIRDENPFPSNPRETNRRLLSSLASSRPPKQVVSSRALGLNMSEEFNRK